jgi:hypothetical protein
MAAIRGTDNQFIICPNPCCQGNNITDLTDGRYQCNNKRCGKIFDEGGLSASVDGILDVRTLERPTPNKSTRKA